MKIAAIHPRLHDLLRARHIARMVLQIDSDDMIGAVNILRRSADAEDHELADALVDLMADGAAPEPAAHGDMAYVEATRARVADRVRECRRRAVFLHETAVRS